MTSATSQNQTVAGTARSAPTLGRIQNGIRAARATCAAERPEWPLLVRIVGAVKESVSIRSVVGPSLPTRRQPGTTGKSPAPEVDSELREYLREWRRAMAKERGIPAFLVMLDNSLDDLCQKQPRSLSELRGVWGFGERKTAAYGRQILEALARYGSRSQAAVAAEKKAKPARETARQAGTQAR